MVHFSAVLSLVALCLSAAVARPLPEDSALGNEVAVSAPNGVVMSDTDELNRNRMSSTPVPQSTWSPPAPLPTGDGMNSPPYSPPPPKDKPQYGTPPPSGMPQNNTPPAYGSGSNNWGSSPYDDCVKQCQAKYPPMTPPNGNSTSGSPPNGTPTSTGKTHTVIVAPSQGVLRYVPFALNASVGDTVQFVWGANNHTVTKGSQLTPCNKTSDSPFASGVQLKDFKFTQVINDTNPLFFYCAVPNHCSKGMFGIINPPNALAGPSSVGSMMQSMVAANPDLGKMRDYVDNATKSSDAASKWGTNFDMTNIPQWAQDSFVENVLYTRSVLAANPDAWKDGAIDMSLGGNPPVIPQDITQVASGNTPGYGSNPGPSSRTSTSTLAPSSTSSGTNSSASLENSNAALATRSGVTVVLAALAAGFFLL